MLQLGRGTAARGWQPFIRVQAVRHPGCQWSKALTKQGMSIAVHMLLGYWCRSGNGGLDGVSVVA